MDQIQQTLVRLSAGCGEHKLQRMTLVSHTTDGAKTARTRWRGFSLTQQFIIMGGLVVAAGMVIIGFWVARQIEDGVTRNAAVATALYVDSFISPLAGELETADTLSIGPIRALDEVFKDGPVSNRLASVKIWKPDGSIVYSSNYDLIGKKFPVTHELSEASSGKVVAGFDDLNDEEDASERASGLPLLEIYSPIRAPWSGEIIAVAEFYEIAAELQGTIASARLKSWMIVAAVMAGMAGLLMTIVHRGSKTIDRQRNALQSQLVEVTHASEQNRLLKNRVQEASERVSELNERFLKRTSAELHDGPAQLLSFASLMLGEASKIDNRQDRDNELKVIKTALDDAMLDIRNVCKGLSLPDIERLTVQEIIQRVGRSHIERTNALLEIAVTNQKIQARRPVKICIYRFVQEALNNAWKHARGSRQTISCIFDDEDMSLSIVVKDDGPGFDLAVQKPDADGLGLGGLRERVRSIGGELLIESKPGRGTALTLQVSITTD